MFLNIVMLVYFERGTQENYHNGLILEWDGNLLLQDCVIVNSCFLVLSFGWLSDVLDAIFTSTDKKHGFAIVHENNIYKWTQAT